VSSQYIVTVPPSQEPITLQDAKAYMRIDFPDDDALISLLISRVRSLTEAIVHRALATQTIQLVYTIDRPVGGELSGTINRGPSWYEYNQQLGANPFGATQFWFELPMPPIQSTIQQITVNTKVTAFQNWTSFPLILNDDGTYNMWIDNTSEPARLYFMSPVTANFWQFIYTCGYTSSYPVPPGLLQPMYEGINLLYDNREAQDFPEYLKMKLLAYRADWM
jgi:hypothetical protein